MTAPGPIDITAALARVDRAHRMVGDIASGTTRWKMTIPVREDVDSDVVLSVALADAERALNELATVRAVLDRALAVVDAARASVAAVRDTMTYTWQAQHTRDLIAAVDAHDALTAALAAPLPAWPQLLPADGPTRRTRPRGGAA